LHLTPAAQLSTDSRAADTILNRCGALAFRFDAQLLGLEAEDRTPIGTNSMHAVARADEIDTPELIVEVELMREKFRLPRAAITFELLVAADARWRAFNWRKCTLGREATIHPDVRTERTANVGQLTCLVDAEVPGF